MDGGISSPASHLPPSVARLEPKELKSRSAHACRAPHLTLRNWDEAPYTLAAIPLTCKHGQTRKYCTTTYLSATQVDYCCPHVFRQYYLKTLFGKTERSQNSVCFETIKATASHLPLSRATTQALNSAYHDYRSRPDH
jgi:hypothetical protein